MARNFIQGIFRPKNPQKYKGDVMNIVYRSSWELKVLSMFDSDPNVLKYSSEETIIGYRDINGKARRYFVDFWVRKKLPDGTISEFLIEVKPHAQTIPPIVKGKKQTKRLLNEVLTYDTNTRKWEAARAHCKKRNMEFEIWTEVHLNIPTTRKIK